MKKRKIQLFLFSLVLVLSLVVAGPVLASHPFGWTDEFFCAYFGGTWSGPGDETGTCTNPPGSTVHDLGAYYGLSCGSAPLVQVVDDETIVDAYCGNLVVSVYCGVIDFAHVITSSTETPISFKNTKRVASAALQVPGWDNKLEVNGLTFDFSSKSWNGTLNTFGLHPGFYSPVGLFITSKDGQTIKCNVGGLTIN